MLGTYKRQIKGDVIVTVALIHNSVLWLRGKETENVHRKCGFILYRYIPQSITFNTLLDAVKQNMADYYRNVGNPKKSGCCCYPRK